MWITLWITVDKGIEQAFFKKRPKIICEMGDQMNILIVSVGKLKKIFKTKGIDEYAKT